MTTEYVLADTGWDISETRLIELRITVVGMGDRIRVFGGSYELDPGRSCARCGRPVIPSCWRLRRRIGHPLVGYEDCTILCNECQRKAAERARLDGLIEWAERWAAYEGTRTKLAKHLAGEMHTQLPRSKAGDRWCFLWETSGDRYSLRKVLERLDPIWKRNGITLKEPPTLTPASGAVAGAEASAP